MKAYAANVGEDLELVYFERKGDAIKEARAQARGPEGVKTVVWELDFPVGKATLVALLNRQGFKGSIEEVFTATPRGWKEPAGPDDEEEE